MPPVNKTQGINTTVFGREQQKLQAQKRMQEAVENARGLTSGKAGVNEGMSRNLGSLAQDPGMAEAMMGNGLSPALLKSLGIGAGAGAAGYGAYNALG